MAMGAARSCPWGPFPGQAGDPKAGPERIPEQTDIAKEPEMIARHDLERKIALEQVKMQGAAVISLMLVIGLTVSALA